MRYAILSDIHGNAVALEKVLADAQKQKVDQILCLGDVVGYGPNPNKCLELVHQHCKFVLLGNHEAGVCGRLGLDWYSETAKAGVLRDRSRVSSKDKEWMRNLPYIKVVDDPSGKFMCAHGTPAGIVEDFDYILSGFEAGMAMSSARKDGCNLLFVGHTHEACRFESPTIVKEDVDENGFPRYYSETTVDKSQTFKLKDDLRYVINVGSVGYPRVQRFTCYAIYDSEKHTVEHRVLDFDFMNYVTEMHAVDIPLPGWLEYHVKCLKEGLES